MFRLEETVAISAINDLVLERGITATRLDIAPRRIKGVAKTGIIAVRVDPSLKARAEAIAAEDGRSVSSWVERLIAREIEVHSPPANRRPRAKRSAT
jgi:hypothetical protein